MGKQSKCKGTTKTGSPCKRNATTGDYCKSHSPDKGNDQDISSARGGGITLEFVSIAQRAMKELEATVTEGVRVQWMRLIFDCCKGAKEEQRLLDGIGSGAEYKFTLVPPAKRESPVIYDKDDSDSESRKGAN